MGRCSWCDDYLRRRLPLSLVSISIELGHVIQRDRFPFQHKPQTAFVLHIFYRHNCAGRPDND